MNHQKMSFLESVECLAEKFQVSLEMVAGQSDDEAQKRALLKDASEKSALFYHFLLLHSEEARPALAYLYDRGMDLEFLTAFQIGFASKDHFLFQKTLFAQKVRRELLEESGLVHPSGRDFFQERIMIPIRDAMGSVIGFTARKFKEETFGPKYINTPETPLFKKSKILFGLNYSRRQIAKERKAIVVEGQIDAMRLIHAGFNFTVASQGTAFTQEHAEELIHLGVSRVYLAFDGDAAGQEAAAKVGHLFQKRAIEVFVLALPEKRDPDLIIREEGPEAWKAYLDNSPDYLTFLVRKLSKTINMDSPAAKAEMVQFIAKKIREWDEPLMVHESLKKLAHLTNTPESMLLVNEDVPNIFLKKSDHVTASSFDPDRILETDLLRLLFFLSDEKRSLIENAVLQLKEEHFRTPVCKRLFFLFLEALQQKRPLDLLSLAIDLKNAEDQLFLSELSAKKFAQEKAENLFSQTLQKILDREWMSRREAIRQKIQSAQCSHEEALLLAKEFDEIKKNRPQINCLPGPSGL
jgi:DNA primase